MNSRGVRQTQIIEHASDVHVLYEFQARWKRAPQTLGERGD